MLASAPVEAVLARIPVWKIAPSCGPVAADGLKRLQAARALGRLQGKTAGEVVRRSEIDLAPVGEGDGAEERRAAGQRLVADRELAAGGRGTPIQRHALIEVTLQRRLADRRRVEAQERRQQVEDVDVRRRGIGLLRRGAAPCQHARRRDRAHGYCGSKTHRLAPRHSLGAAYGEHIKDLCQTHSDTDESGAVSFPPQTRRSRTCLMPP